MIYLSVIINKLENGILDPRIFDMSKIDMHYLIRMIQENDKIKDKEELIDVLNRHIERYL